MGTRSTTTVYEGETPILSFYRQYDGYPSGHGQDLANFLIGKTVVNGISGGVDQAAIVNGAGDLAVRLLTATKNANGGQDEVGGFYAIPHDQAGQEDYHYDVIVGPPGPSSIFVRVKSWGKVIAEGAPAEFVMLANTAEDDD